MNKELYMDQNKWLISVALDRSQPTDGQKAVLANNYSKILSKKLNEDKNSDQPHDEKGRFLPILETVSENGNDEQGFLTYSKSIFNY